MSTQSNIVAGISHSNSVTVTNSLIKSMSYIQGSPVITEDQPSSPPPLE
jgi:hypothetical protein